MWQTEMVLMVRVLLDDLDDPPQYSDERLETLIVLAAKIAKTEIDFIYDYTIVTSSPSISPDPTDEATLDENFQVLVSLKAACLLGGSKLNTVGLGDLAITDGITKTVTSGRSKGYQIAAKSACDEYNAARDQYNTSEMVSPKFILSPFRVSDHSSNRYHLGRREGPFSF